MAGLLDWLSKSVKEVMDMGYPESVAKRIVSGELPMDEASRMVRAAEQGYDPQTYYHAGDSGLLNLDTAISSDKKTADTGTWFTDDPMVANTYLPEGGSIYPVRIKTEDMPKMDLLGQTWSNIESPNGGTVTTDQLARAARKSGESGLMMENVVDTGPNFKMAREAQDDYLDWVLKYQESGSKDVTVNDPTRVKSVNAAYDPEYTGPNILGSRMAPTAGAGLLGALALGDSEDAMAMDSALPMAVQAAGQSAMDAKPDYGRDFGTVAGLLDMLLPLVGETLKPQMMGDAELTEEQRKRGYYRGL